MADTDQEWLLVDEVDLTTAPCDGLGSKIEPPTDPKATANVIDLEEFVNVVDFPEVETREPTTPVKTLPRVASKASKSERSIPFLPMLLLIVGLGLIRVAIEALALSSMAQVALPAAAVHSTAASLHRAAVDRGPRPNSRVEGMRSPHVTSRAKFEPIATGVTSRAKKPKWNDSSLAASVFGAKVWRGLAGKVKQKRQLEAKPEAATEASRLLHLFASRALSLGPASPNPSARAVIPSEVSPANTPAALTAVSASFAVPVLAKSVGAAPKAQAAGPTITTAWRPSPASPSVLRASASSSTPSASTWMPPASESSATGLLAPPATSSAATAAATAVATAAATAAAAAAATARPAADSRLVSISTAASSAAAYASLTRRFRAASMNAVAAEAEIDRQWTLHEQSRLQRSAAALALVVAATQPTTPTTFQTSAIPTAARHPIARPAAARPPVRATPTAVRSFASAPFSLGWPHPTTYKYLRRSPPRANAAAAHSPDASSAAVAAVSQAAAAPKASKAGARATPSTNTSFLVALRAALAALPLGWTPAGLLSWTPPACRALALSSRSLSQLSRATSRPLAPSTSTSAPKLLGWAPPACRALALSSRSLINLSSSRSLIVLSPSRSLVARGFFAGAGAVGRRATTPCWPTHPRHHHRGNASQSAPSRALIALSSCRALATRPHRGHALNHSALYCVCVRHAPALSLPAAPPPSTLSLPSPPPLGFLPPPPAPMYNLSTIKAMLDAMLADARA